MGVVTEMTTEHSDNALNLIINIHESFNGHRYFIKKVVAYRFSDNYTFDKIEKIKEKGSGYANDK